MKTINIRDVAREAGTSISSVSRCLNDIPGVAAPVRKRILAAVHRLGYDVRSGKRRVIALILPTIQVPEIGLYSAQVMDSIRKKAWEKGYGCLMISREDIGLLSETLISGAVSFDYLKEVCYQFPNMKNIPLVCFNDIGNHLEQVYSVHSNEKHGIQLAVEHFYRNHHTRIGFLHYMETRNVVNSNLRSEAFRNITESLGIRNSCAIQFFSNDLPLEEAISMLLKKRCTALLAGGEDLTMSVVHALSLFGKRIPEDLSLIDWEYDGVSEYLDPPRTTVITDYAKLASEALDLLTEILTADHLPPNRIVQAKLLIRKSTARRTASDASTSRSPM